MVIDWFTVAAQALNFLILVWGMKRFLYKPIRRAIDEREKGIAKRLSDAALKDADATKERAELAKKNEEIDQQRAALLSKATEDAKTEGARLADEAGKAADALTTKRRAADLEDARNLSEAVRLRAQKEVFEIARKVLADLATASLEERVCATFTRRLRTLDEQSKAALASALATNANGAVVQSAFALPPDQRTVIQNAINETFSADVHLRYEAAPELVSGIQLTAGGLRVGWNIADYLASLEKNTAALLAATSPSSAPAGKGVEPAKHSATESHGTHA